MLLRSIPLILKSKTNLSRMHTLLLVMILCGTSGEPENPKESPTYIHDVCLPFADCRAERGSCLCDQACHVFDDCCPGTLNKTDSTLNKSPIPGLEYMSCQTLADSKTYLWILDRCKNNTLQCFLPDDVVHISNLLPVTDKNNITYRNQHCAECHGISEYMYWRISIAETQSDECITSITGIQNTTSTGNISDASMADDLLRKGCSLTLYPPVGITRRQCIKGIVEVNDCPSHFLPVRHNKQEIRFRNRECCAIYFGNCTDEDTFPCVRYTLDLKSLPFDEMFTRFPFDISSTSVLFDFEKGMDHRTIEDDLQYLNFGFQKTFIIHSFGDVSTDLLQMMFCFIKSYFETMEDSFSLDLYDEERLQNANIASQFTVNIKIKLTSHQFFRKHGIRDLETWLEAMHITVSTIEPSTESCGQKDMFLTSVPDEDVLGRLEKSSMIQLSHQIVTDKLESYHNAVTRRNVVCSLLDLDPMIPKRRCHRLGITATTNIGLPRLQFSCTELGPPQGVGSSKSDTVEPTLSFRITCVAITVLQTLRGLI